METLTIAFLAACTWAAVSFYRRARARHLNYQAGGVFRQWIAENVSPVLADPVATPSALAMADHVLLCAFHREYLRAIAGMPEAAAPPDWPAVELGQHAALLRSGAKYLAVLVGLERRSTALALRKFLKASEDEPLGKAVQRAAGQPQKQAGWAADAVAGFAKFAPGRFAEYAVEDRLVLCAASSRNRARV